MIKSPAISQVNFKIIHTAQKLIEDLCIGLQCYVNISLQNLILFPKEQGGILVKALFIYEHLNEGVQGYKCVVLSIFMWCQV